MSIAPDLTFKGLEKGIVPVQMCVIDPFSPGLPQQIDIEDCRFSQDVLLERKQVRDLPSLCRDSARIRTVLIEARPEQCEKDQLASLGVASFCPSTGSERRHAVGRRDQTRRPLALSPLEGFRRESCTPSATVKRETDGQPDLVDELVCSLPPRRATAVLHPLTYFDRRQKCWRSVWRDCRAKGKVLAQSLESARRGAKFRIQDLE